MDAETLLQIGSGSFVVSAESQNTALASPNPLPDQQSTPASAELSKSPANPSLMGKIRTSTVKIASPLVGRKTSSTSSSQTASSTTPAPVPATASSTTESPPVPPPKPAKPSLSVSTEIGTPPKRPHPTKPATEASSSPVTAPPVSEELQFEEIKLTDTPEESGELDMSEYHYDYTSGKDSHSLISNEKRKTVVNPRFSTLMDTFSTTNAFGSPKDFSGMFGSDNPN